MSDLLLVAVGERELVPVAGVDRLCCGIGPVEAAVLTSHALAQQRSRAVLHVGLAGAVRLPPGALVIGSGSIYCDLLDPDATLPRIARLEAPADLLATARRALPKAAVLPIATAARVGGGAGYEVEAMEGFGVLRAAARAGVPALEVRVISNTPSETDRARWKIDDALAVLRDAVGILAPAISSAVRGRGDRPRRCLG